MTLGTNAKSVFTKEIRDTNPHHFPNTADDGVAGYDVRGGAWGVLAKVVNDTDQSVEVHLEGTTFDDAAFAKGATDEGPVTVAAGEVKFLFTEDPWAFVRVRAVAAVAPTAGAVKVVYQARRF